MKHHIVLTSIAMLVLASGCKTTKITECKGPELKDCVCTMQYDPVCGCDGKTYSNACVANCSGIKKYTPGECK